MKISSFSFKNSNSHRQLINSSKYIFWTREASISTITYLGRAAPVTLCWINVFTYCGRSTQVVSHSTVCSMVQLCTSERVHASHSSLTDMSMSSFLWNAFCLFSYPESNFKSCLRNWKKNVKCTIQSVECKTNINTHKIYNQLNNVTFKW